MKLFSTAAGLGSYVEALLRKSSSEFNVCNLIYPITCTVRICCPCCASIRGGAHKCAHKHKI